MKNHYVPRDISWLSFNGRVLQEANDNTVPLKERVRFLGIFSNNLDEFFRVRVATLKRMVEIVDKKNIHIDLIESPQIILDEIQNIVLKQQNEFGRIWSNINHELNLRKIFITDEKKLTLDQKKYINNYFEEEVRSYIIPLMIETVPEFPYIRDKSLYLAIVMRNKKNAYSEKFCLIEIPSKSVGRFIILPSKTGVTNIMLLEDLIKFNLPSIFSHLNVDQFEAHVFKVTKDAELDLDQEIGLSFIEKISKEIKNRRKGKPVRFVYEKGMNPAILEFLKKKLKLTKQSSIIPGGHIHNFRHFMDFPNVIKEKSNRPAPLDHPAFMTGVQISDIIQSKDVLLHFPYHNFDPIIDLLREAAMDDQVISIKITAYRLAPNSKIINALINASRNGKKVLVFLELKARFDEEANLEWKSVMEEEGIRVLVGLPNKKVHAKICVIEKKSGKQTLKYGFVSTGNLNEKTAKIYVDNTLLTSNKYIMQDADRVFHYLENWQNGTDPLSEMHYLVVSPMKMRKTFMHLIDNEIKNARKGIVAKVMIKLNSLTDLDLINQLYKAISSGVEVKLLVRGSFTIMKDIGKKKNQLNAISIIDQYLEHSRVMVFENNGNPKVYISSADWMVRNLDHRVEVAVPILDPYLKQELIEILNIQLKDNQKARILDAELSNKYVPLKGKKNRSQEEIYKYLKKKLH